MLVDKQIIQYRSLLGIFPDFSPSQSGGIQESARFAWQGLQQRQHLTKGLSRLFCYGCSNKQLKTEQIQVVYARSKLQAIWEALRQPWPVDTVLIWHAHLLKLLPFFRTRHARVIQFLHGIEVWKPQDRLTNYLLGKVDLFLSNSDYTWQRFLTYQPTLSTKPHKTVALGTNEPCLSITPVSDPVPIMLIISRLAQREDYKGHRELICAWGEVLAQVPNAQLWIVGDGDLRPNLEHMVQNQQLNNHIRFWGHVSEEQKQTLLKHARCLAMPSRNEGFGLVYLEAMRLGRPCLVSTLDAGREVIQPPLAGLAVDPTNQAELTAAIVQLLSDNQTWAAWSQQARRRYEDQFTAAHFQQRLIAALDNLV